MSEPTTERTSWQVGARVIHPAKPEWGVGTITQAAGDTQRPGAQRLTVRFERAGVKTLSTAFAPLRSPEGGRVPLGAPDTAEEAAHLAAILEDRRAKLVRVPDACTDAARPATERLRESVRLACFDRQGSGLLDWAASVTELPDPLSHFHRHELESARERFQREISRHAQSLVRELVRVDPTGLRTLAGSLSSTERTWLLGLVSKPTPRR